MGTLQNLRTILRCTAIISLKVSFKFLLKIILSRCDESWITAKSFIGRISNYTCISFFFFIFNLNFEGTGYSSMATCFATNSLHFVLKLIVVVFTVFFLYRFPSFDRKQHLRNCGEKKHQTQKDKLLSTLSVTLGFSLIFFVTHLSP